MSWLHFPTDADSGTFLRHAVQTQVEYLLYLGILKHHKHAQTIGFIQSQEWFIQNSVMVYMHIYIKKIKIKKRREKVKYK